MFIATKTDGTGKVHAAERAEIADVKTGLCKVRTLCSGTPKDMRAHLFLTHDPARITCGLCVEKIEWKIRELKRMIDGVAPSSSTLFTKSKQWSPNEKSPPSTKG